jgi:hypothetical protein
MSTTRRASAAGPKSRLHQACAEEKALKALHHARSIVDAIRAALA